MADLEDRMRALPQERRRGMVRQTTARTSCRPLPLRFNYDLLLVRDFMIVEGVAFRPRTRLERCATGRSCTAE
jgi:hypothetical protein